MRVSENKYRLIILIIISIFVLDKFFISKPSVTEEIIITPESIGGAEKKIDSIKTDTVYLPKYTPGKAKTIVKTVVDSLYKKQYEDAVKENDTLKAKNLFLESISLDTYKGTLIDNKDVKIDGEFVTRGKLLEYNIDYKIKSDTIKYIPKIKIERPNLSLIYGIEMTTPVSQRVTGVPVFEGKVGLQFKKGDIFTIGLTSDNSVSIGYSRSLTIFK